MFPDLILVVFLGLVFGSFASAIAWRVPRGLSWVRARSACTHCKTPLGIADLVPLFSWIVLRGRCRHCGHAIGQLYPLIELSTLCLCVAVYFVFGLTAAGLTVMMAMPFLVALVAIDFEKFILPDQLNLILGVLGAVYVLLRDADKLLPHIAAALVFAGIAFITGWLMQRLLKKEALGMGDVKFFAVAGLWLGLGVLPEFLMLSGIIGVGIGIFWKLKNGPGVFPFGPALIMSMLVCLGFGAEIRAFWEGLLLTMG